MNTRTWTLHHALPELPGGETGPFRQSGELEPGDTGMGIVKAHSGGGKPAIGAGDNVAACSSPLFVVSRACGGVSSAGTIPYPQSRALANRAPSASACSLAHEMDGATRVRSALVPKPQSVPAMTFSRPTTLA